MARQIVSVRAHNQVKTRTERHDPNSKRKPDFKQILIGSAFACYRPSSILYLSGPQIPESPVKSKNREQNHQEAENTNDFTPGHILKLTKLLQKTHVVLKHMSNVVDIKHQGGHAFEAESEGEAGIDLRIDADGF